MGKSKTEDSLPRGSAVLVLTNIRSFQQDEKIKAKMLASRKSHYGKPFKTKNDPPKFCNNYKSAFITIDDKGKALKACVKGAPCNTWACPHCQVKKAYKLKFELIEIAKCNNLDHVLVLTLKPSRIPLEYRHYTGKYITYLFNRFILTLKRKFKKPIKYVWVKEFQKNGNAHLHILLNCYLPVRYLRKEWVRIGGGHEMDISLVRNLEAAAVYVTGYIVKGLKSPSDVNTFRVGERRYSVSHSCVRPKKPSLQKLKSVNQLLDLMPSDKFFDVYNTLSSPDPVDREIILAPHQENLFKK